MSGCFKQTLLHQEEIERTGAEIDGLRRVGSTTAAAALASSSGVNGRCELARLPYFDIVLDALLDLMHIVSGIVKRHVFALLKGDRTPGAVKDPRKEYKWGEDCDQNLKIRKPLQPLPVVPTQKQLARYEKLMAARLVKDQEQVAERKVSVEQWRLVVKANEISAARVKRLALTKAVSKQMDELYIGVQGPPGLAPGGRSVFFRAGKMKTHDWQQVMRYLTAYLFSAGFPNGDPLAEAVLQLFDVLSRACGDSADTREPAHQVRVEETLAALRAIEDVLPASERCMVLHLIVHLPDQIRRHGVPRLGWMYPFERLMGWVKRYAKSRRDPEATCMRMVRLNAFSLVAKTSFPELRGSRSAYAKADSSDASSSDGSDDGSDHGVPASEGPRWSLPKRRFEGRAPRVRLGVEYPPVPPLSVVASRRKDQIVAFSTDQRARIGYALRMAVSPSGRAVRQGVVVHGGPRSCEDGVSATAQFGSVHRPFKSSCRAITLLPGGLCGVIRQFVEVANVDFTHKRLVAFVSVYPRLPIAGDVFGVPRVSLDPNTSLPHVVIPAELLGPVLAFGSSRAESPYLRAVLMLASSADLRVGLPANYAPRVQ
jgi:hypothetical protein